MTARHRTAKRVVIEALEARAKHLTVIGELRKEVQDAEDSATRNARLSGEWATKSQNSARREREVEGLLATARREAILAAEKVDTLRGELSGMTARAMTLESKLDASEAREVALRKQIDENQAAFARVAKLEADLEKMTSYYNRAKTELTCEQNAHAEQSKLAKDRLELAERFAILADARRRELANREAEFGRIYWEPGFSADAACYVDEAAAVAGNAAMRETMAVSGEEAAELARRADLLRVCPRDNDGDGGCGNPRCGICRGKSIREREGILAREDSRKAARARRMEEIVRESAVDCKRCGATYHTVTACPRCYFDPSLMPGEQYAADMKRRNEAADFKRTAIKPRRRRGLPTINLTLKA